MHRSLAGWTGELKDKTFFSQSVSQSVSQNQQPNIKKMDVPGWQQTSQFKQQHPIFPVQPRQSMPG
jgi:hypothetical protein